MIHTDGIATIANAPLRQLRGFRVSNEGSLFLVQPLDARAKDWLLDNVSDPQWFCDSLVVEHGYFGDLFDGIVDAGFDVR